MNAPPPDTRVCPAALVIPPQPFTRERPAMVQAGTAWRQSVAHRPQEPWRLPRINWQEVALIALLTASGASTLLLVWGMKP
jgi:hypothetical protein